MFCHETYLKWTLVNHADVICFPLKQRENIQTELKMCMFKGGWKLAQKKHIRGTVVFSFKLAAITFAEVSAPHLLQYN
jgi:hypothetical protein